MYDASSYKISAIAIEDAYQRDAMLGDILNELNEYNQLPEEFTWYEKACLYEVLAADTTLMYLDTIVDYANFYYLMNNDNIGRFARIRDLIASGEINRAEELNAEITDTSSIATNTRILNSIYLRTVETDVLDFTQSEEATLLAIALLTPYEGGYGVYTARVMLGIDPNEYSLTYRKTEPLLFNENLVKVYPNPANNQLTIELPEDVEPIKTYVEIFNIHGQRLLVALIESTFNTIDVSSLPEGIMFYRVMNNGKPIGTGKIVIKP
jgi:hypothetical protein